MPAEDSAEVFQMLKPVCSSLLQLRNSPQELTAALGVLHSTLLTAPTAGLPRCFDYVMYPLLFMLEAAAAVRCASNTKSASSAASSAQQHQHQHQHRPSIAVPAMLHDSAAEAVLQCVLLLLERCKGSESDQLLPVLKHVGALLQLPHSSVPEEMKLLCFSTVQAAITSQQQQPAAQQVLHAPVGHVLVGYLMSTCISAAEAEVAAGPTGSKLVRQSAVRTLATIVTVLGPGPQLAFALPGLASGLSQQLLVSVPSSTGVATTGAAAGSSGTVLLLRTLASVITLTLSDTVIASITDCATASTCAPSQQEHRLLQGNRVAGTTAQDALAALQQLSIEAGSTDHLGDAVDHAAVSSVPATDITRSSPSSSGQHAQQGQQGYRQGATRGTSSPLQPLEVKQDAAWLAQSSSKVQTLLAMVLPRLLTHSHPAVRRAVAEVASDLLCCCSQALCNSRIALTEVLLTLVNDDYSDVAQAAIHGLRTAGGVSKNTPVAAVHAPAAAAEEEHEAALAGAASSLSKPLQLADVAARLRRAANTTPASGLAPTQDMLLACETAPAGQNGPQQQLQVPLLQDLLVDVCVQLHESFQHSEASGIAAAKRASAALLCAGAQLVTVTLLAKPLVLQQVCAALVATFAMDPTGASLLLRADVSVFGDVPTPAAVPGHTGHTNGSSSAAQGDDAAPHSTPGGDKPAAPAGPYAPHGVDRGPKSGSLSAGSACAKPLLPRMPLAMHKLVSTDSYKAAAGVARALGRMARESDLHALQPGHGHLQLVIQQLLDMLTAAASPHKQQQHHSWTPAAGSSSLSSLRPKPAAGQWQCNTAAVVAVLTEVLFGASAVWRPCVPLSGLVELGGASATTDGCTTTAAAPPLHSLGPAPNHLQQQPGSAGDAVIQSALLQVVSALVNPRLWSLPTAQPAEADASIDNGSFTKGRIPAQVLGANALLLRGLIDCVGTAARCAGPAFSTGSSKPLRTVLLPLLERLSDPCPMVSAAAAGALDSICLHTGFPGGLSQLVGANADYVVDGVCRQLRNLPTHPRAPQLLAALLREAGVSAALMPLLAEPLRAALSGLSIIGRQQQPGYILAFLYILQYVAGGADQEAGYCRQVFSDQLQQSSAAARGIIADRQGHDLWRDKGTSDTGQCGSTAAAPLKTTAEATVAAGCRQAAAHGKVGITSDSITQHSKPRGSQGPAAAAAAATAAAAADEEEEVPVLRDEEKLHLSSGQLEGLELAWQRAHSAASLAAAAADAATPLLLQRNLRCAVLAAQALSAALHALAAASQALESEELLFDRLADRGPDAALKPTRPTPAKLLPVVHTVWPMLLSALQDTGSVSLLEQQLGVLAQLMQLAGGKFMARRFRDNAWLLLQRLLKSGPQAGALALASSTASSTVGGGRAAAVLLGVGTGPGSDGRDPSRLTGAHAASKNRDGSVFGSALSSMKAVAGAANTLSTAADLSAPPSSTSVDYKGPLAPATLQRVQLAVLGCLASIAGCTKSAPALHGGLVWDLCVMAAPFLADSQALTLREAAAKLLVAAAEVDADAVWLLLLDLAARDQDAEGLIRTSLGGAATNLQQHGNQGPAPVANEPATLPSLQKLLCPVSKGLSGGAGGDGDGGWCRLLVSTEAAACGRRAAKLLPLAAAAHVAWHDKAAEQLRVLQDVSSA